MGRIREMAQAEEGGEGMTMKFCKLCNPDASCCDFCKYFHFNGDSEGAYTGKGFCSFHNKPADPGDFICDDFYCCLIEDRP